MVKFYLKDDRFSCGTCLNFCLIAERALDIEGSIYHAVNAPTLYRNDEMHNASSVV